MPVSPQEWLCQECHQQYQPSHIEKVITKLKLLLERTPSKDPEKLENFLKIANKFVHPNHSLLVEVKKNLLGKKMILLLRIDNRYEEH